MPGNYSWIESCASNNQVVTGGAEKEPYTVYLTCLKSGRNIPPFIIFKGAYPPTKNNPRINTGAYELKHCLDDNTGNQYPTDNNMYMKCSKTANSNGELTIDILWKVVFPGIGIYEVKRGGVFVDDLKGLSRNTVKEYTGSFKIGNDNVPDAYR